jgi:16S rRNA (guanine527-N7)-methyltransferase
VTSREFRQRLVALVGETQVDLPVAIIEPLATYFKVLSCWNSKINLTSLPLRPPSDEAIRRLLLEPLEAAAYVPSGAQRWFDIGSGGGSPAIPMRLACPTLMLTMVESRTRKAAFLRELIRVLGLRNTTVCCERLEDLTARDEVRGVATLVTLRGVRVDQELVRAVRRLIAERGELWIFCSTGSVPELSPWFSHQGAVRLGATETSSLARYAPIVFHVEQSS